MLSWFTFVHCVSWDISELKYKMHLDCPDYLDTNYTFQILFSNQNCSLLLCKWNGDVLKPSLTCTMGVCKIISKHL